MQGIGGAFLFANSTAILTDAFPANQRGTALGINSIAAIAGSFLGLLLGGVLGPVNWHLVFLVSAPIGAFGTVWAYFMLQDIGVRKHARMDWWGNILFAAGLIAILVGITYGLLPYGGHPMGWTNPWVLTAIFGGVAMLVVFGFVETKVAEPLFRLSLFRIRAFAMGNIANLMLALGRGGMQFMLIIWLQGIWLPLHGYSFSQTPLWAGIYLVPLTIGFLLSAPLSGILSDRYGAKAFTVGGALLTALSFFMLLFLPVNFTYWVFALIIALNGFGSGLFASPNRAEMMNAVPADQRGAAGGMIATFMNTSFVLSIGIFFSLMVAGLSSQLPGALSGGLVATGHPGGRRAADLPPAADRRAVRRVPRLQPDAAAARPAARAPARGPRRLRHRAPVLPAADHQPVPRRSRGRVRVRDRGQRDRRHRLAAHRPAPAARRRARVARRRTGRGGRRRRPRAQRDRRARPGSGRRERRARTTRKWPVIRGYQVRRDGAGLTARPGSVSGGPTHRSGPGTRSRPGRHGDQPSDHGHRAVSCG